MKELLTRALVAVRVDAMLRRLRRDRLLILMYHGLAERALEPACWHVLDVPTFERQMAFVASRYAVLPLAEALKRRAVGTLPPRACAITFDDGYASVVSHALPVLARWGLPATVFLVTDRVGGQDVLWPDRVHALLAGTRAGDVDLSGLGLGRLALGSAGARARAIHAALQRLKSLPSPRKDAAVTRLEAAHGPPPPAALAPFRLLGWAEVEAAARGGLLTFGPHSRTHEILARCDDGEVERQVLGSIDALAARLGGRPTVFAYPNGRQEDFDERAVRAVLAAGLPYALTTVLGLVGPRADPHALPRIAVGSDLSFARFRLLAAGC